MSKRIEIKRAVVYNLHKWVLEVLLFFEGIIWDMLRIIRGRRERWTLYCHKKYKKYIEDSENAHMREDVTEIVGM